MTLRPRRQVRSLGEEAFARLRRAILRGELKPGQRLIEEKIALDFGASRTPVREAFLKLEQEGLVKLRSKGGFVVSQMDLDDVDEVMDMRTVLEGHAAARAARRRTDQVVAKLRGLLGRYQEAMAASDVERMVKINTEFHDALYQASGSRRLIQAIAELRDYFYGLRKHILSLGGMGQRSHQDHVQMVEAIDQGDAARAEELVREHISRARLTLRREGAKGNLEL
ncbi:MAG: GntR family transcriptional regulator [Deltaproteobacteria bacterium]|nr:GntR family transcriptional regulator [Deltaproteobacteria bacterium]